jgi:hypothetical protein
MKKMFLSTNIIHHSWNHEDIVVCKTGRCSFGDTVRQLEERVALTFYASLLSVNAVTALTMRRSYLCSLGPLGRF